MATTVAGIGAMTDDSPRALPRLSPASWVLSIVQTLPSRKIHVAFGSRATATRTWRSPSLTMYQPLDTETSQRHKRIGWNTAVSGNSAVHLQRRLRRGWRLP